MVAHTRLPSVRFRSWSRFLAVSLQVMWVINPAVGCHYFPPGLQLPPQPLRRLLPISLLGEHRHNGCEQFAQDSFPTASRLRFEPGNNQIKKVYCSVCEWKKSKIGEYLAKLQAKTWLSRALSPSFSSVGQARKVRGTPTLLLVTLPNIQPILIFVFTHTQQ